MGMPDLAILAILTLAQGNQRSLPATPNDTALALYEEVGGVRPLGR